MIEHEARAQLSAGFFIGSIAASYLAPMDDELRQIGKLGKPWGHQGELTVQLDACEVEDLAPSGWLFVDIDGQKVPFRYASLRETGRAGVLMKFEDLDDPQRVGFLVGHTIHATPEVFSDDALTTPAPDDLIGLRVLDEVYGDLGEVVAMDGTDRNPVMVIKQGDQEVLVPLADELIVHFDQADHKLHVRTPPGLIEMYRKQ